MRLSNLAVVLAFMSSTGVLAVPNPHHGEEASSTTDSSQPKIFPAQAKRDSHAREPGAETNGERMKRGLGPLPPRSLAKVISPRIIDPAPPVAMAQPSLSTSRNYVFIGCFTNGVTPGGYFEQPTCTTDADLANFCAGKQDQAATNGMKQEFAILSPVLRVRDPPFDLSTFFSAPLCLTSATPTSDTVLPCTSDTSAFYRLAV